jgi:hypothetical protein
MLHWPSVGQAMRVGKLTARRSAQRSCLSVLDQESTAAPDTRHVSLAVTQVSATVAIGVLVGVPVVIGVATGAIMRPRDAWRDTFEVAAAGSGIVAGLLLVAIIVALIAEPSNCNHGQCNSSDNAAGVQALFAVIFVPVLYPSVLVGAATGKLLGRAIGRLV